jgi:hypothetical protein
MVVPFANYVFLPLFSLFVIYTLYFFLKSNRQNVLLEFAKYFKLVLFTALFVFIGFAFSSEHSLFALKEVLYTAVILFMSFGIFFFIGNLDQEKKFTGVFFRQVFFVSSAISILGLIKFILQIRGFQIPNISIIGTSLINDYNNYILFSFFGILSLLYLLIYSEREINLRNGTVSLLMFIYSFNIFFSFSRRGFFLLILLIVISILFLIITYSRRTRLYTVVSVSLTAFMIFVIFMLLFAIIPENNRRKALNSLGISVQYYTNIATILVYKYSTIFSDRDPQFYKDKIWSEKPDPKNPETGWNSRKSSMLFPLTGDNVEIVPEKSIGYMMDSTCNASVWANNAYSYTDISGLYTGDTVLSANEVLQASVYCFVSKDFNGTWARLSTEAVASGKLIDEYDLKEKGKWQKLQISFKAKTGIPPVYLYWSKFSESDFRNLNGFIVYASPQYRKMKADPKDPESGWGVLDCNTEFPLTGPGSEIIPGNSIGYRLDNSAFVGTWNNNAYSYTDISILYKGDSLGKGDLLDASVYCYVSNDFNGTWARLSVEGSARGETIYEYDLNKKGTWQKLSITFENQKNLPPVYLYWAKYGETDFANLKGYVIFAHPEYFKDTINTKKALNSLRITDDNTKINKSSLLVLNNYLDFLLNKAHLSFQDTLQRDNVDNYLLELENNNLSGTRYSRWYYSWIIFKNYPIQMKIFGGGFDYLELLGKEFGEVQYDYPHNPFLSAFLYSGIIGGLAYIWFMFLVFYYYIKYYRHHIYFFICFLVAFYFSFFSVNTHFTIPAFAFFSIIPFLTRYLVEKEKYEPDANNLQSKS